jgi:superfamily I DNA/RNA helicase
VTDNGLDFEAIARGRAAATEAIVNSGALKRLIVAGPGTGKTYTFKQALSKAIRDSGAADKGLALTFIRNLVADLAEALSDVADVFTFHGFCKHQMHRHGVAGLQEGWDYYPALIEVMAADLHLLGLPMRRRLRVQLLDPQGEPEKGRPLPPRRRRLLLRRDVRTGSRPL